MTCSDRQFLTRILGGCTEGTSLAVCSHVARPVHVYLYSVLLREGTIKNEYKMEPAIRVYGICFIHVSLRSTI